MDIEKTFESIYDRIKERIGSPFFSSAILSWPLINYKFLIACLGDGKFMEKVYFIDTYIYPDARTRVCLMVLLPATVGLFYTVIYPFLDIGLTAISKQLFVWKQHAVLKVERKTPIDSREQQEFFAAYDAKVKRMEAAFADQTKRHMDQYANARNVLADISGRLKDQCLKRLAEGTGLLPHQIESIPQLDTFVLDQLALDETLSLKARARKSALLKSLISVIEQVNANTANDIDAGRVANLGALAQALNTTEIQLLDSLELLQALNLVQLGAPTPARTIGVSDDFVVAKAAASLKHIFAD